MYAACKPPPRAKLPLNPFRTTTNVASDFGPKSPSHQPKFATPLYNVPSPLFGAQRRNLQQGGSVWGKITALVVAFFFFWLCKGVIMLVLLRDANKAGSQNGGCIPLGERSSNSCSYPVCITLTGGGCFFWQKSQYPRLKINESTVPCRKSRGEKRKGGEKTPTMTVHSHI